MKKMKRLSAILIAVLLMVSMMAVPASAAEENKASITINGTTSNVTYNVYKIFDIVTNESTTGETTTAYYYYKPTSAWESFFNDDASGAFYGTIADNGYITWENENLFNYSTDGSVSDVQKSAIAAFASYAATYAKSLTPDKSVVSEGASVTIGDLTENGYYLVVSSLGAIAIAGPVTSNGFTINEKNSVTEAPTIVKTVGDGRTEMSVDFGAEFDFKVVVTLNEPVAAGDLVFTDIVPKQIHVTEGSLVVTKTNSAGTTTLTKDTDYTVQRGDKPSDIASQADDTSNTHVVSFSSGFSVGDTLTFTYTAKLVPLADGTYPLVHELYTNLAEISYGDTSVSDTASVFTLGAFGFKYFVNPQTLQDTPLGGAGFVLMNSDGEYYVVENNVVSWMSEEELAAAGKEATIEYSDANGNFDFYGIAAGTYSLVEKVVPAGYTGITDPVSVTVSRAVETSTVRIENVKGSAGQLPSTGGMGTTIFYAVGGVLVIGALSLLIVRKRTTAK